VKAIPSYKAHRVAEEPPANRPAPGQPHGGTGPAETVPDTLSPQGTDHPGGAGGGRLATAGAEGYEADDVIGTLATRERHDLSRWSAATGTCCSGSATSRTRPCGVLSGRGLARAEVFGPVELALALRAPGRARRRRLRRDGHAARRPLRRAARRGRDRREDRPPRWCPGSPGGRSCSRRRDRGDSRLAAGVRTKLAGAADYLAVVAPVGPGGPGRRGAAGPQRRGARRPRRRGPAGRAEPALGARRVGSNRLLTALRTNASGLSGRAVTTGRSGRVADQVRAVPVLESPR